MTARDPGGARKALDAFGLVTIGCGTTVAAAAAGAAGPVPLLAAAPVGVFAIRPPIALRGGRLPAGDAAAEVVAYALDLPRHRGPGARVSVAVASHRPGALARATQARLEDLAVAPREPMMDLMFVDVVGEPGPAATIALLAPGLVVRVDGEPAEPPLAWPLSPVEAGA